MGAGIGTREWEEKGIELEGLCAGECEEGVGETKIIGGKGTSVEAGEEEVGEVDRICNTPNYIIVVLLYV